MNKQQLAAKIWESANKLRSKIEANEYKDYILGFIFYKFLSDKEEQFLRKDGWESDDLRGLTEDDADTVAYCRRQLGYLQPAFYQYTKYFKQSLLKARIHMPKSKQSRIFAIDGRLLREYNTTKRE